MEKAYKHSLAIADKFAKSFIKDGTINYTGGYTSEKILEKTWTEIANLNETPEWVRKLHEKVYTASYAVLSIEK